MTAIIASTFGWDFFLLLAGWPAFNWLTALLALILVIKKRTSTAGLMLSAIPVASALWVASDFLRYKGTSPGMWHIVGFFIPAFIAMISAVTSGCRALARRSPYDDK